MSLLSWLFDEPETSPTDEIADIRSALGKLIKLCLRDKSDRLELKVWDCSIRDVPVGSWRFIIERIPDREGAQGNNG